MQGFRAEIIGIEVRLLTSFDQFNKRWPTLDNFQNARKVFRDGWKSEWLRKARQSGCPLQHWLSASVEVHNEGRNPKHRCLLLVKLRGTTAKSPSAYGLGQYIILIRKRRDKFIKMYWNSGPFIIQNYLSPEITSPSDLPFSQRGAEISKDRLKGLTDAIKVVHILNHESLGIGYNILYVPLNYIKNLKVHSLSYFVNYSQNLI